MKNRHFLALALLLATSLATLAQISNFEMNSVYKTAWRSYRVEADTTFGRRNVFSTVGVSLQWPTRYGDNDVTALQDTILTRAFGTTGMDVDTAIKDFLSRPIGSEEHDVTVVPAADEGAPGYSKQVRVNTIGFCERFIVYECNYWLNEGGAHPNYYSHYINYDIARNRMLMFNDIFAPGNEDGLLEVLTQALLDKFYASSVEDLARKTDIYADRLFASRDVYLTGEEVVFHYNPYDIAPWSAGEIDVAVPAVLLLDFLTPEALDLLGYIPAAD